MVNLGSEETTRTRSTSKCNGNGLHLRRDDGGGGLIWIGVHADHQSRAVCDYYFTPTGS